MNLKQRFCIKNMMEEQRRLASYELLNTITSAYPATLARIGLFLNHPDITTVKCFLCLNIFPVNETRNWIIEQHRHKAPDCPMAQPWTQDRDDLTAPGEQSGNKPLDTMHNISQQLQKYLKDDSNSVATDSCNNPQSIHKDNLSLVRLLDKIYRRHVFAQFSPEITTVIDPDNLDFILLKDEGARIGTFDKWPLDSPVKPTDLAKAGFFYLGKDDQVQCAFCRGILHSWQAEDTPLSEHRRNFPHCNFIEYTSSFQCIKNSPSLLSSANSLNLQSDNPQQQLNNVAQKRGFLKTDSIQVKHLRYKDEAIRISSFRGVTLHNGQCPNQLAQAGFFYIGPLDMVCCFSCNIRLHNWQRDDDPWTEHVRWSNNCDFVQQQLQANDSHRNAQSNQFSRVSDSANAKREGESRHIENRVVKARMDWHYAQHLISIGYSKQCIERAIREKLSTTGDDFENLADMLQAVQRIQDCEQQDISEDGNDTENYTENAAAADIENIQQKNKTTNQSKLTRRQRKRLRRAERAKAEAQRSRHENNRSEDSMKNCDLDEHENSNNDDDNDDDDEEEEERNAELDDDTMWQNLVSENQKLKEVKTCKICLDIEVDTVFLPCGHLVSCEQCSRKLKDCPICRRKIRGTVKTFLS